jgi:excisionase family DNA binding protein
MGPVTVSRPNTTEPAGLIDDREAARRLGVSPRTVREMRFDGRLPYVDLGYRAKRIKPGDIDKLIRSRTRHA